MVKAQRKTSHCLRRQSASKMEVEKTAGRLEVLAQGETEAPQEVAEPQSEDLPPEEREVQPQDQETTTVDQSCQTEEMEQSNPEPNHCQSAGCCIEPGDPPLLQQPLQTSKSGIQQIIECFRSGTGQLKHMLLREVDTIFECKLCRSLFRGLPNLITHKEYYCLTRISEPDGPSGDDKQSVAVRDLLEAIYPKKDGPDYVVRLEPIQASSKAVFQYLSSEDELARYPPQTPRSSHNHSPEPWDEEEEEEEEELEDLEEDQDAEEVNKEKEQGNQEPVADGQPNRMSEPEEEDEDVEEESAQPEEDGSSSGVEDVIISCCLCGKDFNSRRSVRRHCRKMHQTKLEELRKFTETRTVPISLLSMVKGRPRNPSTPTGKSCPVCSKSFATKANVRRHFDEVHRGLRRDAITPDIATRPGQPLSLESTPPRKRAASSPTRGSTPKSTPSTPKVQTTSQSRRREAAMYNLEACRCLVCKRKYSSQLMLRRHMRIVHKITKLKSNGIVSTATAASAEGGANASANNSSAPSSNVRVKLEAVEPLDGADSSPASSPGSSDLVGVRTVAAGTKKPKVKKEEGPASPKSSSSSSASGQASGRHPTLSVGFDFKQLFCKLCKRQFSSRQNLTKHIELHTDGTDIFIKFYRCPLCRYESRRKRDVLRHITVVHKKSTVYLAKIMPKLENRAIKRPAEMVLNNYAKRTGNKEDINGRSSPPPPPSPPVTRKQDLISSTGPSSSTPAARKQQEASGSAPPTPSPSVTRKQDRRPTSPPLTRRSDKLQQDSQAAHNTRRAHEAQQESGGSSSTEVRVTKNFSLHACDVCGRAFAKKIYLESHKRSHRNAMAAASSSSPDSLRKGVSTRSKALLW